MQQSSAINTDIHTCTFESIDKFATAQSEYDSDVMDRQSKISAQYIAFNQTIVEMYQHISISEAKLFVESLYLKIFLSPILLFLSLFSISHWCSHKKNILEEIVTPHDNTSATNTT